MAKMKLLQRLSSYQNLQKGAMISLGTFVCLKMPDPLT